MKKMIKPTDSLSQIFCDHKYIEIEPGIYECGLCKKRIGDLDQIFDD